MTNFYYLGSVALTLFRMGFFGPAHGWGEEQIAAPPPPPKKKNISYNHETCQLYLTQSNSKKYMNRVIRHLSSADISIFSS